MHRRDWHTHGEATCVLRTHGQADNKNTQLQQNDSNPRFLILQRAHVVRFSHAHRHTDAHTEATAHPCSAVTLPCVSHMNVKLSLMRISPFGLILLNSLEISTCRFLKIIVWKGNKAQHPKHQRERKSGVQLSGFTVARSGMSITGHLPDMAILEVTCR